MKKRNDKRAKLLIGIVNKEDELAFTSAVNRSEEHTSELQSR